MTEAMNYSTYGRLRRRSNRRNTATASSSDKDLRRGRVDPSEKQCQHKSSSKHNSSKPDGPASEPEGTHGTSIKQRQTQQHSSSQREQYSCREVKDPTPSGSNNRCDSPARRRPLSSSRPTRRASSPRTQRDVDRASSSPRNNRSPSPLPRRRRSTSRKRSSFHNSRSVSPVRNIRKSRSFDDRPSSRSSTRRSSSLRSSTKSNKSNPPKLTQQLSGFDLHSSKNATNSTYNTIAKGGAKASALKATRGATVFIKNKLSCIPVVGSCKKNKNVFGGKKQHFNGVRSTTARGGRVRSTRGVGSNQRVYQLEDGSATYLSSDEEDDMSKSSYSSYSSGSSYHSESVYSSSSSEDDEEFFSDSSSSSSSSDEEEDGGSYFSSSFVEDRFVSDGEISGAEDLPADKEGDAPSISERSKALLATLEKENDALRASVVALRVDWETIVKRMNTIQENAGDDYSIYTSVSAKSANLEAISALRTQAMETLDQEHTRRPSSQEEGRLSKKEKEIKSYKECIEELLCENERLYDNILALSQERENTLKELDGLKKGADALGAADKSNGAGETEGTTAADINHSSAFLLTDEEIAKSHKDYMDSIASLLTGFQAMSLDEKHREKAGSMGDEIMQLVSKIMAQRFEAGDATPVSGGGRESASEALSRAILQERRRSSASSAHQFEDDEVVNSDHSVSSVDPDSDRTAKSDSDEDDEDICDEFIVNNNDSMNSLFGNTSPSFSSTREHRSSPTLEIIHEYFDSDSDYASSELVVTRSPRPRRPGRVRTAVRRVADRILNKDDGRQEYHIEDDGARRSFTSTEPSDVEETYYPKYSPTTSRSNSSSARNTNMSVSRSRSKSFNSNTSSNFSSIKEGDEVPFEEDDLFSCEEEETMAEDNYNDEPVEEFDEDDQYNDPTEFTKLGNEDTMSTCASVSAESADDDTHATSGSESTRERKGISITVVSRSSRHISFPSSRSHTYVTFFTTALLKDQVDAVLQEQFHESMIEMKSKSSRHKKRKNKRKKYQGEFNEEGERHGYGIYISKNGNEYRGEWQHNCREGLGVVKIGNGNDGVCDVFEGQFEANKKNGIGVYHYTDGECDLSRYKDDIRIGDSLRWSKDRKEAFVLTEAGSQAISLEEAVKLARGMGTIIH
eukprot:scaffold1597_cov181-Alexandrium_tamarense.AAC.2